MGVKDMSLRHRLLLGGSAIVLVPLIFIGALIYLNSARVLEDISKVQAVQIAKSISGMIEIALKREIGILETIAADPDFVDAASSGQYSLLNSKLAELYLKLGTDYEGLAVFNKEGIISADGSDKSKIGISVADRDYVRLAREGRPVIGSPAPSKATGEPIFGISVPIMSDGGVFQGGVLGIVKADFLVTYISSLKL